MLEFWSAALALSLLLYVLLDGFDLGIGILFLFAPDERHRRTMMDAVSPVWDGNETWLIISGATLFAAFPAAYAILLGAFYLPVIVMLCGLILRGVAFEFRLRSRGMRWLWTASFGIGSVVAAFMQGAAIGAFVQELPVRDGIYVGGPFAWFSAYAVLCGFGLVLGYALLGAAWLIHKAEGPIRDFGYRVMPRLMIGLAVFLALAAIGLFAFHMRVANAWIERPLLLIPLAIGTLAGGALVIGVRRRIDRVPLPAVMTMFVAAFVTMVGSLLPYIVPFSLTLREAAAPHASLAFIFWGAGLVVLPVTLIYTAVVYWVFRGKVQPSSDADDDDDTAPPRREAAVAAAEQARGDFSRSVTALRTRLHDESAVALAGDIAGSGAAYARTSKGLAVLTLAACALLPIRRTPPAARR